MRCQENAVTVKIQHDEKYVSTPSRQWSLDLETKTGRNDTIKNKWHFL